MGNVSSHTYTYAGKRSFACNCEENNGKCGLAPPNNRFERTHGTSPFAAQPNVSPHKTLIFRPCFFKRYLVSQALFSAWLAVSLGFACKRLGNFKPFWPPTLAQQALLAIILQALRRLRGALLFHRVGPSLSWGCPFWVLGLTRQSSRPAYCGRLTFGHL